ncbi:MAG: polymer-forming cytoskeletal protein, partial [bacterium]|nr:polymer-forming cytoskeletal protein [bacterium]
MQNIKPHYVISLLAAGGIALAALNFTSPPLFENTDNFVLFAQEEIKLEQGVQVSSGDVGSNGDIDIQKDAIVNGNLFADKITVDKNTTINGNVSFNKLKLHKDAQILGTQTKPVQLPIAILPEIPDFPVGTQDFKFEGQANTLAAGNYRDVVLEESGRLVLSGGVYNLRKLELKDNSTLIFNSPTTINIQFKLKGQKHVSILPGQSIKPTDLVINYLGIRPKNEKEEKEDDDEEINALHDEKEKKDLKEGKIGRPVVFGKESFLNFKLIAPKASVKIGETSTLRGQVLARKVRVGEGAILSLKFYFSIPSKPEDLVVVDGINFFVNSVMVNFTDDATSEDAERIAVLINAKIGGFGPVTNLYKFKVFTRTVSELEDAIAKIEALNDTKIEDVSKSIPFTPEP